MNEDEPAAPKKPRAPYISRFPLVRLLDQSGQRTGMTGQVFGRVVDSDGADTGRLAVMLTAGGQGCKHWPAARIERIHVSG